MWLAAQGTLEDYTVVAEAVETAVSVEHRLCKGECNLILPIGHFYVRKTHNINPLCRKCRKKAYYNPPRERITHMLLTKAYRDAGKPKGLARLKGGAAKHCAGGDNGGKSRKRPYFSSLPAHLQPYAWEYLRWIKGQRPTIPPGPAVAIATCMTIRRWKDPDFSKSRQRLIWVRDFRHRLRKLAGAAKVSTPEERESFRQFCRLRRQQKDAVKFKPSAEAAALLDSIPYVEPARRPSLPSRVPRQPRRPQNVSLNSTLQEQKLPPQRSHSSQGDAREHGDSLWLPDLRDHPSPHPTKGQGES